ncbi:MAG: hypothetical protein JW843_11330 [Candidatus Aminicenantes bacterium]|nr:hypothetical protein [Candidatus Aminicenantes bacterium]
MPQFEENESYQANFRRLDEYAGRNGLVFNADSERVNKVVGLMTRNFVEFGHYFCPCKQSHPLDPAKDTRCPCREIDEEIAAEGNCFCRLFYRPMN